MITIQLTVTEQTLLGDLLERVCAYALAELRHTDDHEYRDMLQEQEEQMRALCEKIRTCQSS
jgi:hypothetical protein